MRWSREIGTARAWRDSEIGHSRDPPLNYELSPAQDNSTGNRIQFGWRNRGALGAGGEAAQGRSL